MLEAGGPAPEYSLAAISGEPRNLRDEWQTGPVLIVFFKIACPTCHLTLPLLNRLSGRLAVVGISQDDAESTQEFVDYFGVAFPVLIDPAIDEYKVSAAYGIAFVPSLFMVNVDGTIAWAMHGFDRVEMASRLGPDLFRDTDNLPEMKPGCGSKN